MATTKEVAINITAVTKGLDAGFAKLKSNITEAEKLVADSSQKMINERKNFADETDKIQTKMLQKEAANAKKQTANLSKQFKDKLSRVKGDSQKELQVRQEFLGKFEKLAKDTGTNVAKNLAAIKPGKPIETKDIFKIDPSEVKKDFEDIASLQRDFKTTSSEINRELSDEFKAARQVDAATSEKGFKNIQSILERERKNQIKIVRKGFAERIEVAKKGSRERIKLEKERSRKLAKIQKDFNTQQKRLAKASANQAESIKKLNAEFKETGKITAGGKIFSKVTEGMDKVGVSAGGAGDALGGKFGGALSGTLGKMGPWGAAAAAVIGALVGIGTAAFAAAQKFEKFNKPLQRLGKNTGLAGEDLDQFGEQLLNIPRPAGKSAEDVAKLAAAVGNFTEDTKEIPKTTENILNLMKAFPESTVDPLKVVGGIGRLGAALGDTDKALNEIAKSAEFLQGRVDDPLDEAITEIGTAFSKASNVISDSDKALLQTRKLFEAFVETGVEVSEATSNTENIFEQLRDTLLDTKRVDKVNDILKTTGKTLADVGLEADNVDVEKLFEFLSGGSEEAGKLKVELGGAGEFLNTLEKSFAKSGKTLDDYGKSAAGMTEQLGKSTGTIAESQARIDQQFENIGITIGSAVQPAIAAVTSVVADGMDLIGDLFKSSEQEFLELTEQLKAGEEQVTNFTMLLKEGTEIGSDQEGLEYLDKVRGQLGDIAEASPEMAAQLQAALDADNLTAAEKIELTNTLLDNTLETTKAINAEVGKDAIANSWGRASEAVEETEGITTGFIDFMTAGLRAVLVPLGLIIDGLNAVGIISDETADKIHAAMDFSGESAADDFQDVFTTFDDLTTKVEDLKAKRAELQADEVGNAEAIKELNKEIALTNLERSEAFKEQADLQGAITSGVKETAEALAAQGELTREGLLATIEASEEYQDIPRAVRESANFQEILNEQLDESINSAAEYNAEKAFQLEQEDFIIETLNSQLETQFGITDAEKATVAQKIEALKAAKANIEAKIAETEATIAGLSAAISGEGALANVKNETLKVQNEINKAQGDAVRGTVKNISTAKKELAGMKAKLATFKAQNKAIDSQIAKLEKGAKKAPPGATPAPKKAGGGRASRADRKIDKAAKSAEKKQLKALNDAIKKRLELEKKQLKALEDRQKEEAKARDKQRKAELDSLKAEQERKNRAKDFAKELKNLGKSLKDQLGNIVSGAFGNLGSVVDQFINGFTQALLDGAKFQDQANEQIKGLSDGAKEAAETLSNEQSKRRDLEAKAEKLNKQRLKAEGELLIANRDLKTKANKAATALQQIEINEKAKVSNRAGSGKAELEIKQLAAARKFISRSDVGDLQKAFEKEVEILVKIGNDTKKIKKKIRSIFVDAGVALQTGNKFDEQRVAIDSAVKDLKASLNNAAEISATSIDVSGANKATASKLKLKAEQAEKEFARRQGDVDKIKDQEDSTAEAIEKQIEAEKQAEKKLKSFGDVGAIAEKLKVVGEFAKATRIGLEIFNRTKEIADLEQAAAEAETVEETEKLLEQAAEKQEKLAKDLEKNGKTVAGIVKEIARTNKATKDLIEEQEALPESEQVFKKTPEIQARLDAVEDLNKGIQEVTESTKKLGDTANIEGKRFNQIFMEFEGDRDELIGKVDEWEQQILGKTKETHEQAIRNFIKNTEENLQTHIQFLLKTGKLTKEQFEELLSDSKKMKKASKDLTDDQKKSLMDLKSAYESLQEVEPELISDAAFQDTKAKIEGLASALEKGTQAFEKFQSLSEKFEEAKGSEDPNAEALVGASAVQDAGRVLMSIDNPFAKLIGAVVVLGTSIVKNFLKINDAVSAELGIAEKRSENLEKELQLLEEKKALADDQIKLNSKALDQGWERIRQLKEENRLKNEGAEKAGVETNVGLTDQELIQKKSDTEAARREAQELLDDLNQAVEDGKAISFARIKFDQSFKTKSKAKKFLKKQKDQLEADILNFESELDNIDVDIEFRAEIEAAAQQQLQEDIGKLDFLIESTDDPIQARKFAEKKANLYKGELVKSFAKINLGIEEGLNDPDEFIDIDNVLAMSQDSFDEWLTNWVETSEQADANTIALIQSMRTANEEARSLASTTELIDRQLAKLEKQRQLGRISEEKFQEETEKLLNKRLKALQDEENRLKRLGATEIEILDAELARLDVEIQLLDLMNSQNGALSEQDKQLINILRKRQEFLKESRKDGLTPEKKNELKRLTDSAVSAFVKANPNASEQEITEFKKSLPQFRKGGTVDETGLAVLHGTPSKPEFVMSAEAVERIGLETLQKMNSMKIDNPFAFGKLTPDRFLSSLGANNLTNTTINNNFGGISQTNNLEGGSGNETVDAITNKLMPNILKHLQQSVDAGTFKGTRS